MAAPPQLQLLLRNPSGIRSCLVSLDADKKPSLTVSPPTTGVKKASFSPDGSSLIVLSADSVSVNDVQFEPRPAVMPVTAEISAGGTFVHTFTKPDLTQVFTLAGSEVLSLRSKKNTLQFSANDALAAHAVTNEIRVVSTSTWEPLVRVHIDGVTDFSLCPRSVPGEPPVVVAFIPATKSGKPASVGLFKGTERVCFYNSFRAEEATFKWAPDGQSVLCKIETTEDATGQSYYGESRLILLSQKAGATEVTTKEGAIHDFGWSPTGAYFCASAGKSPPKSMLYDGATGAVVFDFGDVHRNICSFAPFGRFLVLAGFGNLAGDMDFWDLKRKKKLGSNKADAAVGYGWSPDGRLFMTCTLAPRMNVDNLVALYSYRGVKLGEWRADGPVLGGDPVLLDCRWRPAPLNAFPDLPPSPRPADQSVAEAPPPPPPQVYRPKHASSKIADMMKEGRTGPAGAVKPAQPQANKPKEKPKPHIPGYVPVEQPQKQQPQNQQPKKAAEAKPAAATAPPPQQEKTLDQLTSEEAEKLLRRLRKQLKQIAEIEEKGPVNDEQKAKMAKKKDVEKEVSLLLERFKLEQ